MALLPLVRGRRRGATRRHRPRPGARRLRLAGLDRWLDRLVDAAVIIALVVGGIALALTLLI
ncbi:MAG: hypothetical protein ACOC0M_04975 [Halomonas sp.]